MANEFKHKDAGVQLTQTEDNATDRHTANNVSNNDLIVYSSSQGCWIRATAATIAALLDHGTLTGLDDADHNAVYFQETEFLNTSAGAGDAGKPIKLDAGGKVDATMVNDADIDHGSIGGLTDDDHTQYTKKATLTTKGDIYAASAASTPARVAVGTNTQVLTADSTQGSGIKWATPAGLTVAETEVFSGTSPATSAWTDLDLSGTIGSNAALVLLRFYNAADALKAVSFRVNGDTDESHRNDPISSGCAHADIYNQRYCYFIIAADSSGIIEWKYEAESQANVTIDLVAYIK